MCKALLALGLAFFFVSFALIAQDLRILYSSVGSLLSINEVLGMTDLGYRVRHWLMVQNISQSIFEIPVVYITLFLCLTCYALGFICRELR
jgi:hypothetical protein